MKIKSLICLLAVIILLILLTSCSVPEKRKTSNDDNSFNSIDKTIVEQLEHYDSSINIRKSKLEMKFFEKEFIFQSSVIPKDIGVDFEKIKSSFAYQKENGNLFPVTPSELELQFSDSVPQSVTWYEIYVCDGKITYPNLSIPKKLDNVDVKTVLPIGLNLAACLDSGITIKEYYRIIRIVCDYDGQTVEYNVFFDCNTVKGCLP